MTIATQKCPCCKKENSVTTPLFLYSLNKKPTPLAPRDKKGKITGGTKPEGKKFRFACAPCLEKIGATLGDKLPLVHYNVSGTNPSGKW